MDKKQIIIFGLIFVVVLVSVLLIINSSNANSDEIIETESQKDYLSEEETNTTLEVGDMYSTENNEEQILNTAAQPDLIEDNEIEDFKIDIGELYN